MQHLVVEDEFAEIIKLIKNARINALRAVNTELINLYWTIGEYVFKKIAFSDWGDSVVTELSIFIRENEPDIKGFSDKNIWRMKQFYETYKDFTNLSTLLREISRSNNLTIFSRCKTSEEREFYLNMTRKESLSQCDNNLRIQNPASGQKTITTKTTRII